MATATKKTTAPAKAATRTATARPRTAAKARAAGASAPTPAVPRTFKVAKATKPATAAAGNGRQADAKPKKPKLVRDSFTMPKAEFAAIATLKERAARAGTPAKKSELLRAGLQALAAMGDASLAAALAALPPAKP